MSAPVTERIVIAQLSAMGCEAFDIGVLRQSGRMLLRERWTQQQIVAAVPWLKHENARGGHIFVRPHGEHALSLLDDLTAEAVAAMEASGFEPAVVVETSPHNFQAWLNHGRMLNRELSTRVAKELASRFGGDPSSADWRHFGRLAGFTNQKRHRRLGNGLAPFVRLKKSTGLIYRTAGEFVKALAESASSGSEETQHCPQRPASPRTDLRPLADFHADPRYGGDLHRADMAWALHAASRGLSEEEIEAEILHARDLSKKGGIRRQMEYARRTAAKAITRTQPLHP
jgi:hypothetical protein